MIQGLEASPFLPEPGCSLPNITIPTSFPPKPSKTYVPTCAIHMPLHHLESDCPPWPTFASMRRNSEAITSSNKYRCSLTGVAVHDARPPLPRPRTSSRGSRV